MPGCYGMIGVVERKGEEYGDSTRLRKRWMDEKDVENGTVLRAQIYRSAGNRGIFDKMDKWFPELCQSSVWIFFLIADMHRRQRVDCVYLGLHHLASQ